MAEKMMIDHEDLPFAPLAEGSPVHVAVLWGNPETGSAAVMVELPRPIMLCALKLINKTQ